MAETKNIIDLGTLIAPIGIFESMAMYESERINDGIVFTVGQVFTFETADVLESKYGSRVGIYYEYADHVVVLNGVAPYGATNLKPNTKYTAKVTAVADKPDSIYETAVLI